MSTPINLIDLDRSNLESFFNGIGEKNYRAKQVMQWMYKRQNHDFELMTDLSKGLRERLHDVAQISLPTVVREQVSTDGTRKWLFAMPGGSAIETVFIPEDKRGTLCVSSQIGCTLTCSFCATGRQGFNRNLSTGEIISQLILADKLLIEAGYPEAISNVVLMGMGEPLSNYNNVLSAVHLMLDDFSYGLSKRRVTLSTAGLVPQIDQLRDDCPISLAVSLHAGNDELRDVLVPINKKYPLKELMAACRRYVEIGQRHRVTFEYILIDGVNDTLKHANELIKIVEDVRCKINLIPYNPVPGIKDYARSKPAQIYAFQEAVAKAGLTSMTRKTRGDDIDAACGQLAGQVIDKTSRSKRLAEESLTFRA